MDHADSSYEMGRNNAAMAVVDSGGRVFGVQGVKVIDSSGFRFTPPGALRQRHVRLLRSW